MTPPTDEKPPETGGEKPAGVRARSRRRRRGSSGRSAKGAAKGAADKADAAAPGAEAGSQKRRRGRGRRGGPKKSGAAAVLAERSQQLDSSAQTEVPLSQREVANLKIHFEFLRTHRKALRLKVNAAEDLLLNGVTEPTHRGVCQHLLGKVDRSSVLRAAERLEPAAAAKFLSGVIRFSAEIEYILLFLEKVQLSSSQPEAVAALAQGLQRIAFDEVSASQMRRVLQLISELFDAAQRPRLLLGMLEGRGFRQAFDDSIEGIPDSLVELVLPLRAAQEVILHGRPNRFAADALRTGIYLLMDAPERELRAHPEAVRQRLFEKGVEACRSTDHALHRNLGILLSSFPKSEGSFSEAAMTLVRHLLLARQEEEAKKILKAVVAEHPRYQLPGRWLERLDRPRIDHFVVEGGGTPLTDVTGHHRRSAGFALDTMMPVWLQIADADHIQTHESTARLLGELCIPGVAPLLARGITPEDEAYFATPNPGPLLSRSLEYKGGLSMAEAIGVCKGAISILASLATAGVEIPDTDPRRFARDRTGGTLLVDLAGGSRASSASVASSHLALAREFCLDVSNRARHYLPPDSLGQAIASAGSFAELVRVFATLPDPQASDR